LRLVVILAIVALVAGRHSSVEVREAGLIPKEGERPPGNWYLIRDDETRPEVELSEEAANELYVYMSVISKDPGTITVVVRVED